MTSRALAALAFLTTLPAANQTITPSVTLVPGPVNGVIVTRAGKKLAIYGDPRPKAPSVERVLFTHHRRDVAWAGRALVERGAKAVVPASEAALFAETAAFWEKYRTARFHDYSQQSSRILAAPLAPVQGVKGGDTIDWEGLAIQVLDTSGYTRGAVSYLIEIDGKRIACVGDLIYGDGRILDLFSLQDAIPEAKEDGYHGYGARAGDVLASLRKIAAWKPDILIPARGPAIADPQKAIADLTRRMQAVFASHFEIDALRWYRGDDKLRIQAARILGDKPVTWMPMAEIMNDTPPAWIVPIANSRLILSRSGHAFLVDCGNPRILQQVKKLRQDGLFQQLDGIWVTHYHDDHTNMVQAAAAEFHCPVYTCPEMRDILESPNAYRMPAGTPNAILSPKVMPEGSTMRWNEYEFTFSYFPGQTIYHGGFLVKKDGGETIFFIGDSFTPSGMDDYCLLNRNFFEPEQGFAYCMNVLKRMRPDYLLINQHVLPTFRYSPRQLDRMIENFSHRRDLLRELFPWDDPNYGVDEQWARFYPYQSTVPSGKPFALQVIVRNHSPSRQTYRITPHVPAGWQGPRKPISVTLDPREERTVPIPVTPPPVAATGIVTADVAFGKWDLREWSEALVTARP